MSDQVNERDTRPESKRERQKRRRQERAAQLEQHRRRQRWRRGLLTAGLGALGVAVVFGLAVLIADNGGDAGGDGDAEDVPAASVEGGGLAQIPQDGNDPATGQEAPGVTGESFAGETVTLGPPADTPQAVLFLAHWCPHCQREVPEVVQWVEEDGILPAEVELVAVSTLHDPTRANWPPDQWLAEEGWPGQVLADPDESAAEAFGLAATPSWVFVDADGTIAQRVSGRLSRQQLERALTATAG